MNQDSVLKKPFRTALEEIVAEGTDPDEIRSFLLALSKKGESVAEIAEAVRFFRERAVSFPHAIPNLADNCGTGGDGASTFNISTAAAFVAGAAGAKVAKHGNRSASSRSGSADILEALGVPISQPPALILESIQKTGFGFLFAPDFHPALKKLAPIRRALGVRTLFNLIGPLLNPAQVKRQLLGVSDPSQLARFGEVLEELETDHAWVVSGKDGLDEITTTDETIVLEIKKGKAPRQFLLKAWEELGLSRANPSDFVIGSVQESAEFIGAILKNEAPHTAEQKQAHLHRTQIVLLNAAALLVVSGLVDDLKSGLAEAERAIHSGAAWAVLEGCVPAASIS